MNEPPQLLKVFVILGGVLLLAGTILLVVMLMMRAGGEGALIQPLPAVVALPPGSAVERMTLDGRRLVLLVVDEAGHQTLVVVDAITGEREAVLELRAEE